jgi:hypothetical protein
MAKSKNHEAIKAGYYRSRQAKNDSDLAALQFKDQTIAENYQPLFKKLHEQFPLEKRY